MRPAGCCRSCLYVETSDGRRRPSADRRPPPLVPPWRGCNHVRVEASGKWGPPPWPGSGGVSAAVGAGGGHAAPPVCGAANGVRGTGRGVGGSMERPLSGAQLHSAGGCVPDPVNTMERCKKHYNSPFEVNQGSRGRQDRNMIQLCTYEPY